MEATNCCLSCFRLSPRLAFARLLPSNVFIDFVGTFFEFDYYYYFLYLAKIRTETIVYLSTNDVSKFINIRMFITYKMWGPEWTMRKVFFKWYNSWTASYKESLSFHGPLWLSSVYIQSILCSNWPLSYAEAWSVLTETPGIGTIAKVRLPPTNMKRSLEADLITNNHIPTIFSIYHLR